MNYEGPFLYLLAGTDCAILFDTGATAEAERLPLRSTVDQLIGPQTSLIVAHTHAHRDHVAADGQFELRPNTIVLGHRAAEVAAFFEIVDWPYQAGTFELGGRLLEVLGIPGHEASSIAVYDPATRLLLTGDTVYPGRLYVKDMPAFSSSLDRLVAFAERRPVSHVLGCHIEMTSWPGRDYPLGTDYQPDEAPLPMTVAQLAAVRDAAVAISDRPGAHQFDDFAIFNGPCRAAFARQSARYYLATGRRRLSRRR
ncbi:MAG: MBL fold metallo-hydrolase [Jatrophihabitantaceae bacterium]